MMGAKPLPLCPSCIPFGNNTEQFGGKVGHTRKHRRPIFAHLISAAEGNGPVNALDVALRKDLGKYQKYIEGLELTDYRVRILNAGTEAVTRVLIESQDETGERWTTVGVSPNIIDASFQALMDSIVYKLVRSNAPA